MNDAARVWNEMLARGVDIRILVPRGQDFKEIIARAKNLIPGVDIRISDADLNTRISIMVCDRKEFMSWQLRDDGLQDPYEAGGVAIYSNISSLAESYATIFDNLWKLTEFAENLRIVNSKLEDNEKAMKEFIDTAAHELRTPIQPILGLSAILQEDQGGFSSEQGMLIDVIARNARRLERLAEVILDVTRIESGKLNLSMEKLDLDDLVEGVVNEVQKSNLADHINGELEGITSIAITKADNIKDSARGDATTLEEEPLMILGDRSRLGEVISNLLSNAIKFSKEGEIIVRIHREKALNGKWEAIVSVRDDGPSIAAETLPRLFEKFVSKSEKGIGLGLNICKRIIESHGGTIWARNAADGPGATFSFSLPLVSTDSDPA